MCVAVYPCAGAAAQAVTQCKALERLDLSRTPEAPLEIIQAREVASPDDSQAYCETTGYVAPSVGFVLRLPRKWNGKLLQLGCGGHCGSTEHVAQCDDPIRRGYACIVTDDGHKAGPAQGLWAYGNWQAQIDYFVRAAHVTSIAGRAIAQHYYTEAPRKAYFMGCSAGGREAMMEAQRFPWDFDGIISGSPSLDQTGIRMNILWGIRALAAHEGKPLLDTRDLQLLHDTVVERCDMNDGVKDGLIGDPRRCGFDPSELLCRANDDSRCLDAKKVAAVKRIYAGATTTSGQQIYFPGAMKGSELGWPDWFSGSLAGLVAESFRYYALHPNPGPVWNTQDFDFDQDPQRLGLAESLYSATNPDLRRFRERGGKLLAYTGWNDAGGMPLATIDYYETVEKLLGRPTTQGFFRLFVIPGMNHCTGGDGAFSVDYLSALERWAEKGEAPAKLLGAHISVSNPRDTSELIDRRPKVSEKPAIEFTRPIYPYPTEARYGGKDDPRDAASFEPAEP